MVLLIGRWVVARSTFCVTIQFSLPLTLPSPFPLPGYSGFVPDLDMVSCDLRLNRWTFCNTQRAKSVCISMTN